MITKQQAIECEYFHHVSEKNADGTPVRVRRNGKTQTWKRSPNNFRIPVKYGICARGQFSIYHYDAHNWEEGYGS